MYNLKVYTSKIYVANYGDTVTNHGSVYRPCLNYQKRNGYYSRHTQKYINWKSNVPMVTKTGSIKTLIFRAYDLCTEIIDCNEELEFLKDTFIANDFPINIVDRIF